MPINPDLLVSAAMLQDYLVDKDTGKPLVNGIVSLYKDQARSFFKNWYYQTGTPGAYTWIPLDNPLHLSSVGTIEDPNGNDVIPFYYPFQEDNENVREAYYITVYSSDENGEPAVLQFTRENFPFNGNGGGGGDVGDPTFRNYIINNTYWRNIGSLDATDVLDGVIAPSQHDGYTNGDIRFIKNVAGAEDTITFNQMTTTLENDITPEYYLNFSCTTLQTGETTKCIQYPISLHINTLQNVSSSIVFQGQNVAGNANNFVDIQIYQYLGTGALVQPDPIFITRVTLGNTFQKFIIPFIFPDASGAVVGEGGDDALFLRVQYPLSATCNINHTKPQLYLSNTVPDNDFDTYDQIGAIIDSPRTGDDRTSFNSFQPFGWVPANDGSIGSSISSATTRANTDTWPLYNLLWNSVTNTYAPVSTGRGSSAIADFSANKTLTLSRNLGRVIAGTNPILSAPVIFTNNIGINAQLLVLSETLVIQTGTPIQFSNTGGALPSPLVANTIYFAVFSSPTGIAVSTTLDNAYAGTLITFTSNSTGTSTFQSALGAFVGESAHSQTIAEMPAHNHPGSTVPFSNVAGARGGSGSDTVVPPGPGAVTVASQGGGAAFNIVQPTAYRNVFLKL
jgi:hypothetical protein